LEPDKIKTSEGKPGVRVVICRVKLLGHLGEFSTSKKPDSVITNPSGNTWVCLPATMMQVAFG
jgi:hypothetical protein